MDRLEKLGWNAEREGEFAHHRERGLEPARVVAVHRAGLLLGGAAGEMPARMAGRLREEGAPAVVGDWVAAFLPGTGSSRVEAVLPRRTSLVRGAAGRAVVPQVLVANVDVVFVVAGLDGDFNPRRVERTLVLVFDSGARPVILLNKADECPDVSGRRSAMERAAPGVAVHVISALTGEGVASLERELGEGRTAVLIGSSGVGKSTLVNRLLGVERQSTSPVRAHDSRGRHATTTRELFVLPGGGVLVDTPGLRELQLWAAPEAASEAFADLAALAARCRFRDCRHLHEPGCSVQQAVAEGVLPPGRLGSYHKLQGELRHIERQMDARARSEHERRWRSIHKLARRHRPRG